MGKNKSPDKVVSKYDKIMEGLGIWISFYRSNPHRFAIDYLGMTWLKPFQQVLINLFMKFTYTMVIASRGMGKSQLVAAACCVKCILYPRIKICIAAGKRGQSVNVLNKIVEDFMSTSPNLCNEIAKYNTSPSDAFIIFKNGSTIKVVTASDSARSARANCIIGDEFVQIKKTILDKVIRKFKAGQRTPNFYNKPE
jgi:phage terminase large subunit-like protein